MAKVPDKIPAATPVKTASNPAVPAAWPADMRFDQKSDKPIRTIDPIIGIAALLLFLVGIGYGTYYLFFYNPAPSEIVIASHVEPRSTYMRVHHGFQNRFANKLTRMRDGIQPGNSGTLCIKEGGVFVAIPEKPTSSSSLFFTYVRNQVLTGKEMIWLDFAEDVRVDTELAHRLNVTPQQLAQLDKLRPLTLSVSPENGARIVKTYEAYETAKHARVPATAPAPVAAGNATTSPVSPVARVGPAPTTQELLQQQRDAAEAALMDAFRQVRIAALQPLHALAAEEVTTVQSVLTQQQYDEYRRILADDRPARPGNARPAAVHKAKPADKPIHKAAAKPVTKPVENLAAKPATQPAESPAKSAATAAIQKPRG